MFDCPVCEVPGCGGSCVDTEMSMKIEPLSEELLGLSRELLNASIDELAEFLMYGEKTN